MEFDWPLIFKNAGTLGIAYVLALPVAWHREVHSPSAGLRTFPLTAIAACGFALLGLNLFTDEQAQSRLMEGLITGIGFIGGGAILKSDSQVSGTATAAGLWATGAIGLAVAGGRYEIAILISTVTFITFALFKPVKSKLHHED